MPATQVLILDGQGQAAGRLPPAADGLPARIRRAPTRAAFEAALAGAWFPVAFVDVTGDFAAALACCERTLARGGLCVALGPPAEPAGRDWLLELSVTLHLPSPARFEGWRELLERLVAESQRRLSAADGQPTG